VALGIVFDMVFIVVHSRRVTWLKTRALSTAAATTMDVIGVHSKISELAGCFPNKQQLVNRQTVQSESSDVCKGNSTRRHERSRTQLHTNVNQTMVYPAETRFLQTEERRCLVKDLHVVLTKGIPVTQTSSSAKRVSFSQSKFPDRLTQKA
jgi:hypothetical protein